MHKQQVEHVEIDANKTGRPHDRAPLQFKEPAYEEGNFRRGSTNPFTEKASSQDQTLRASSLHLSTARADKLCFWETYFERRDQCRAKTVTGGLANNQNESQV